MRRVGLASQEERIFALCAVGQASRLSTGKMPVPLKLGEGDDHRKFRVATALKIAYTKTHLHSVKRIHRSMITQRKHAVAERREPLSSGKIKIAKALRTLLAEKECVAITTSEIARTAGVTEALIYKYFRDKRDLMHHVLGDYLDNLISRAETDVKGSKVP